MNNFTARPPSEPYLLVAAGSGPKNIELPDGTITSTSEVKRELGIPEDHVVYGMAALGYAAKTSASDVKKTAVRRIVE